MARAPGEGDFVQATILYRDVFDADEKGRFNAVLLAQVSLITRDQIRERFFRYWQNADEQLDAFLCEYDV